MTARHLPPGQPGEPYRVAMVCLGNICRSPMADVVVNAAITDAGLDDVVTVDSCGTGAWHIGDPMDTRAASALRARGYDPTRHRAQRFTRSWYADHDLLLAMDAMNFDDVTSLAPDDAALGKVSMFRAYDPYASEHDDEVPDPWYGGGHGFEDVLDTIERTAKNLVDVLREETS